MKKQFLYIHYILKQCFLCNTLVVIALCLFFNLANLHAQTLPIPVIDSISVTTDNNIIVAWHLASDVSITRFVIYRKTIHDFGYIAIDTVNALSPRIYTDQNNIAVNDKWLYTVASMSSTDSLSGMSDPHSFITFDFKDYDLCQSQLGLSWNSYVGATNVTYSTICMSGNDTIEKTNQGYNNYGSTSVANGQTNVIFVRAEWEGGSSTSARRAFTADTINVSKNAAIALIKNSDKQFNVNVNSVCYRDTDSVILYTYKNNQSILYNRLVIKPDISGINKFTILGDNDKFIFKPAVKDICGNEYTDNLAVESIFLEFSEINNNVLLRWNGVSSVQQLSYNLFKDDGQIELIESFSSGGTYTYSLEPTAGRAEKIHFFIQATNDTLEIYSNYVSISLHDDLLWPNAFVPDGDGIDEAFGPVVDRFVPDTFFMTIFNKQGVTLFITHNINRKWNGMHNGILVPKGAYIWQAEYTISGRKIKKSGLVNVIY